MTTDLGPLAVVIPAYNEAVGLPGFLQEIDAALSTWPRGAEIIVVDDASTDGTADAVERTELKATVRVVRNDTNLGHGPTLLRAYRLAVRTNAALVWHVDGDGQFAATDFSTLQRAISAGADVAIGVRRNRVDPFHRKLLSAAVRKYLAVFFGVRSADPNTPFRLYRRGALSTLLERVPDDALIPSIYLTVLAARGGLAVSETAVAHYERRGGGAGTTWRGQRIPIRLLVFASRALRESVELRRELVRAAPIPPKS